MIATPLAMPLLALTADDLMSRYPVTIPRHTSLREAAHLLHSAQISGAPVVDEQGRCVGLLSTFDFLHWAKELPEPTEPEAAEEKQPPQQKPKGCPYQVKGRLLTGEEMLICTLTEGSCPLQLMVPTTAGRHTAICLWPLSSSGGGGGVTAATPAEGQDQPQTTGAAPSFEPVQWHMTTDLVTVEPDTPLAEMARMMVDAHVHHLLVLDAERRPVGIVTSTDILAALLRSCQTGNRTR